MMTRATILGLCALTAAACGGDDNKDTPDAPPPMADAPDGTSNLVRITDNITADTTFTADKIYVLEKNLKVFVTPGHTLTIMPGTEIRGENGSVLVISRGAKIMAQGTVEKPIVLTTSQPSGQKTPGFWGGLLVLGAAPINTNVKSTPPSNEALFEAFSNADAAFGTFGGTTPDDNSGVIEYVRIEFAGFNFVADREFNNLTLCGVGSGTTIDFVQVHGGSDDGIEFFGGTVNVKHIVSSQNQDDGFDTDNGWSGKAQFVIVQNVSHPATLPEATNGYESDNHGTAASYEAEPRTLPTVSNVTLIGDHDWAGGSNFAAVFRRGTGGHYSNHIWMNFQKGPEIRDAETRKQLDAGNLTVTSSILFHNDASASNLPAAQATGDIDEALLFNEANSDVVLDPGLPPEALSKTAPSFKPLPGAAALTGGVPPTDPFFDQTATFRGAVGTDDWTAGWTRYPQN
ncbi:MAG TPA: hypothetical protein VFT22_03405 [Kofleriaceae bacterium]|nr:hypothetical protein [Kofleriaceae bacterium]